MKRSKLLLVLYITIFQIGITTYAQKVTNITFRQEQSNIIVSYDLETKTPCKVSLYVSTNGGATWQGPLIKVTGDVGSKVVSGNHNIAWNVLEEFKELKGNNIKFQVRAANEVIQTVKIGNQIWMAKNLDVSTYRNGDIIPEVKDSVEWKNLTIGAWCYYNNDIKNGKIYGKLYNWYAVNDPRGLAPKGFHIPSILEMLTLKENISINSFESHLRQFRNSIGLFYEYENDYFLWSSTDSGYIETFAKYLDLKSNNNYSYSDEISKESGISVLCIKD